MHNTNFIFIHLFDIFEESRFYRDFSFLPVGNQRRLVFEDIVKGDGNRGG